MSRREASRGEGVARRLLSLAAVVLVAFVASRALIRSLPGDPLETVLAESGATLPAEELRHELKLDRPFLPALVSDLAGFARGDLGRSLHSRQPIAPLLASRLAHSALLALCGVALSLLVAVPLGLLAAARVSNPSRLHRAADRLCTLHGALAAALPTPWIGPMLTYALAVRLALFPIGNHLALPTITLGLAFSGLWARLVRERVRETLLLGAAPGARARGVPEWLVLLKYGLMPASGPLLAYLGTQLGALVPGAFVTEVIFDWPGMGTLFVDAVLRRDYPVVEAAVFASAIACVAGNALGDLAQALVDPRQSREWLA